MFKFSRRLVFGILAYSLALSSLVYQAVLFDREFETVVGKVTAISKDGLKVTFNDSSNQSHTFDAKGIKAAIVGQSIQVRYHKEKTSYAKVVEAGTFKFFQDNAALIVMCLVLSLPFLLVIIEYRLSVWARGGQAKLLSIRLASPFRYDKFAIFPFFRIKLKNRETNELLDLVVKFSFIPIFGTIRIVKVLSETEN